MKKDERMWRHRLDEYRNLGPSSFIGKKDKRDVTREDRLCHLVTDIGDYEELPHFLRAVTYLLAD